MNRPDVPLSRGSSPRPDYGIDGPGVRRGMFIAGLSGTVLAFIASRKAGRSSRTAQGIFGIGVLAGMYGLGMASYMTCSSKAGKLRGREHLLDLAGAVVPWTGREAVLDVGCGRGLMLVGAARRLTEGRAIGIDVWRNGDQAGNDPQAALRNAEREGVADRVRVETGDARELPFADAAFDVVLSHWVIHNLPSPADRVRALDEMLRVLRPGGTLVLADIAHHRDYLAHLKASGRVAVTADVREDTGGIGSRLIGIVSFGSFRPQALIARC